MRILGLDLGCNMGYASVVDGKIVESGHKNFKKDKRWPGNRYAEYESWLSYVIKDVDLIFYEDVKRHRGTIAAHVYGAFEGILYMVACRNKIKVVGLGVGQIKKFATGMGNADKDLMIVAANDIVDDYITDDNEADAIHITLLGYNNLNEKVL